MSAPLTWPIDSSTDTYATVGTASTEVLAANDFRMDAALVNDSDEVMYLARGNDAVMNQGIRLNANGGSYNIDSTNLFKGAINAICASGGKNICVTEGE